MGAARFGSRRLTDAWSVRSLADIRATVGDRPSATVRPVIPVCAVQFPAQPVPIDPYLLGVLLGDGTFRHRLMFATADASIVESVRDAVPMGCVVRHTGRVDYRIAGPSGNRPGRHPLMKTLRALGLWGKYSHEKHVPAAYLFNSVACRLALLQGLMDADGSIGDKGGRRGRGKIEYSTTSPALAEAVTFLVRSLGGKCRVSQRVTHYTYKGERRPGRLSYRVWFCLPGRCPFRLPRKAQRWATTTAFTPHRLLVAIEPAGVAECVCIAVENASHTYITRDFVVTHNTLPAAVEVARAVTGQDHKFPRTEGRAVCVGKSLDHIGGVMWRKLGRAGAFRMIRDATTKQWRAFRPWDAADAARHAESKKAPPLIPPRLITSIAWENKAKSIPKMVTLANGWEITFYSSESMPPQGIDIDLFWFDEEIVGEEWFPEMLARLLDRGGRGWWSATPQAGTEKLFELHERAGVESDQETKAVEEFHILLADNKHFSTSDKQKMASLMSEEEQRVRVGGEFLINSFRVFPEFNMVTHGCAWFDVPRAWTRYAIIDPGRQVCAVLFGAIPPPWEPDHVYLFDELYIQNCTAVEFGRQMQAKCRDNLFESFLIDHHGGRIADMGSGRTVESQYSEQLKLRGIRSMRTGYQFQWGSDDVAAGLESFRNWLHIRDDGTPRLQVLRGKLPNFEYEIKHYRYKRTGNILTDKPEERGRVHLMADCRYFALCRPQFVKPRKGKDKAGGAIQAFRAKQKRQRDKNGSGVINLGPGEGGKR